MAFFFIRLIKINGESYKSVLLQIKQIIKVTVSWNKLAVKNTVF